MPPARRALSVAEKPSVAKELANILSSGRANSRRGVSPYNSVFEFDGRLDGGPCQMVVTSVLGHLMEMDFEEQYRSWRGVDIGALFDAPIKIAPRKDEGGNSNNEAVVRNLEQAVRGCTDLILWLDCDREGEAIGFEVMGACQKAQRNLRVRRARFSALIPRDIHHALEHLVQPDGRQSDAVASRAPRSTCASARRSRGCRRSRCRTASPASARIRRCRVRCCMCMCGTLCLHPRAGCRQPPPVARGSPPPQVLSVSRTVFVKLTTQDGTAWARSRPAVHVLAAKIDAALHPA